MKNELGPNSKRISSTCPDCKKKKQITFIQGIPLGCDQCQDERAKLLAAKPKDNWCAQEHVNKILRTGPDKYVLSIQDGEPSTTSGKGTLGMRQSEVIFILSDGKSIGAKADDVTATYMSIASDVVGVVMKPNATAKDPRAWLKEWYAAQTAEKEGELITKLNPKKKGR